MATYGSLSTFDPSKEDWTSYTDRMKPIILQRTILLMKERNDRFCCPLVHGASVFKLIQNLIDKDKLDTTSYDDIVKKVKVFQSPFSTIGSKGEGGSRLG